MKERYITIQEFMVRDLKLKGNELIIYALIYGFSQDSDSEFKGSITYMQEWLQCSRQAICDILKRLIDKGVIEKISTGDSTKNSSKYRTSQESRLVKKLDTTSQETGLVLVKKLDHNNTKNNLDIILNGECNNASAPIREEKHKYGQYSNVLLTEKEYNKLLSDFENGKEAIEYLSEHRATKGYKAKSDYLAIRKWVFLALEEKEIRERENEQRKARLLANEVKVAGKETQRSADPFAELKKKLKDEPESESKWRTNGL